MSAASKYRWEGDWRYFSVCRKLSLTTDIKSRTYKRTYGIWTQDFLHMYFFSIKLQMGGVRVETKTVCEKLDYKMLGIEGK
jgi:hypothetical protein